MGFYVKLIIPLGAIGVGALAGSGYGIASAWTGAKIGRGLLLTVCLLLVAAYFVAKYIEFRDLVTQYPQIAGWSFFDYYHFGTTNMTFTSTRAGAQEAFEFGGRAGHGAESLIEFDHRDPVSTNIQIMSLATRPGLAAFGLCAESRLCVR